MTEQWCDVRDTQHPPGVPRCPTRSAVCVTRPSGTGGDSCLALAAEGDQLSRGREHNRIACPWPDEFDPWESICVKQNYGRTASLQLKHTDRGDWEPLTDTESESIRAQALPKAQIEAAPTPNRNGVVL